MQNKIKQNTGFTFVEMLACVVVLVLVCLISSTGMNLAMKSYQASIYESDSQMLEAQINTRFMDVLRYVNSVTTDVNGIVTDIDTRTYQIDGVITTDGRYFIYQDGSGNVRYLLQKDAYSKSLYIEDYKLKYDALTGVFNGTYVIKSDVIAGQEKECSFACRAIAK